MGYRSSDKKEGNGIIGEKNSILDGWEGGREWESLEIKIPKIQLL